MSYQQTGVCWYELCENVGMSDLVQNMKIKDLPKVDREKGF